MEGQSPGGGVSCPSCRRLVPDGGRFCRHCGWQLVVNMCQKCGVPVTHNFCSMCGTPRVKYEVNPPVVIDHCNGPSGDYTKPLLSLWSTCPATMPVLPKLLPVSTETSGAGRSSSLDRTASERQSPLLPFNPLITLAQFGKDHGFPQIAGPSQSPKISDAIFPSSNIPGPSLVEPTCSATPASHATVDSIASNMALESTVSVFAPTPAPDFSVSSAALATPTYSLVDSIEPSIASDLFQTSIEPTTTSNSMVNSFVTNLASESVLDPITPTSSSDIYVLSSQLSTTSQPVVFPHSTISTLNIDAHKNTLTTPFDSPMTSSALVPTTDSPMKSSAAIPATDSQMTSHAAIPATDSPMTSHTAIPATDPQMNSHAAIPATDSHMTSHAAIPATDSQMTSHAAIPATHSQMTSHAAIPATDSPMTSHTAIPATDPQMTSHAAIPATDPQMTSHAAIPATDSQMTSHTAIPATDSQMNSHTAIPATDSPMTSHTAIPATDPQMTSHAAIPATDSQMTSHTAIPATDSQMNSHAAIPATDSPMTSHAAIPATDSPMTSHAAIPATDSPMTSHAAIPATDSPMSSHATIPATDSPMTSHAAIPDTDSPMSSHAAIPATDSPMTSHAAIPDTDSPMSSRAAILATNSPVTSHAQDPTTDSPMTSSALISTSAPMPTTDSPMTSRAPTPSRDSTMNLHAEGESDQLHTVSTPYQTPTNELTDNEGSTVEISNVIQSRQSISDKIQILKNSDMPNQDFMHEVNKLGLEVKQLEKNFSCLNINEQLTCSTTKEINTRAPEALQITASSMNLDGDTKNDTNDVQWPDVLANVSEVDSGDGEDENTKSTPTTKNLSDKLDSDSSSQMVFGQAVNESTPTQRTKEENQQTEFPVSRAYRKTDNDPEVYCQPTANNKASSTPTESLNGKFVSVHFTVMISCHFKDFNLSTHDVQIRFDNQLGGWGDNTRVLSCAKLVTEKRPLMFIEIDVPTALLVHKTIQYKYVISNKSKCDHKYEYIPQQGGVIANRYLRVDNAAQRQDYFQYDGLAFPAYQDMGKADIAKRIFSMGFWSDNTYIEEFKTAAVAMMPQVKKIEPLDDLRSKISEAYVDSTVNGILAITEGGVRLATALLIIDFIIEQGMQHKLTDKKTTSKLCRALRLQPNSEGQIDEHISLQHFLDNDGNRWVSKSLSTFLNAMSSYNFTETDWPLAVPVLHLLTRRVVDGKIMTHCDINNSDWWGTTGIQTVVNHFKDSCKIKLTKRYFETLGPLFDVDPLLPRTLARICGPEILSSLGKSEIDYIPCDVLLAILFELPKHIYNTESQKAFIAISKFAKSKIEPDKQKHITMISSQYIMKLYTMAMELLHLIVYTDGGQYKISHTMLLPSVNLTAALIRTMHKQELLKKQETRNENMNQETTRKLCDILLAWFERCLPDDREPLSCHFTRMREQDELLIYYNLLQVVFPDEISQDIWTECVTAWLTKRLNHFSPDCMIDLIAEQIWIDTHHPRIEQCFNKAALHAVDLIVKNPTSHSGVRLATKSPAKIEKIKPFISSLLERSWPATDEDRWNDLSHILTWPLFHDYLAIYCGKKPEQLLQPGSILLLEQSHTQLQQLLAQLLDGSIEIRKLQLVFGNKLNVLQIAKVMQSTEPTGDAIQWDKVIEQRQLELNAFDKLRRKFCILRELCSCLKQVATKHLDSLLNDPLEMRQLLELVTPQIVPVQVDLQTDVIFFKDIQLEIRNMLDPLSLCHTSSTFKDSWRNFGKTLLQDNLMRHGQYPQINITLLEVYKSVWLPANKHFCHLKGVLKNGTILLHDVDKVFQHFDDDNQELYQELHILLEGDVKCVDSRIKQIHQYRALAQSEKSSQAILALRDKYRMTGDFTAIETLVAATTNKNQPLCRISNEVVEVGNDVRFIDSKKEKCLHAFFQSKGLVEWLQNLKDKATEAKRLVNHALDMVQGQDDEYQERVVCLQSVITGFAPFLFDMKPDIDFRHFMELFKLVWHAVEIDPQLPSKLVQLNNKLDWLKDIKKSVSSTESSAIAEAENINLHGIYTVGQLDKGKENRDKVANNIHDVIHLRVPLPVENSTSDSTVKMLHYSLQDLHNLQNKLMLVAGKSTHNKEKVDMFVEILDGITRLANVLIDMGKAGSILFNNWRSDFHCNPNRKVNCTIDFGLADLMEHGLTADKSVIQHIYDMCEFMEICYQMWIKHVNDNRGKYFSLNYFTTQQLVMLRSELVKLCQPQQQHVDARIFSLLHLVKNNTNEMDVQNAVTSAIREIKRREQAHLIPIADDSQEEDVSDDDTENEAKIYAELIEIYPAHVAAAAVKTGVTNTDEGMVWCEEHLDDEEETASATQEENVFSMTEIQNMYLEMRPLNDIANTFRDEASTLNRQQRSLRDRLEELWRNYMETVSSSVTDYLGVEHLGLILEHLSADDQSLLNRPFPTHCQSDQANLVICQKEDLLRVVLSLYATGKGQDLPIPQTDEVLLCNEATTPEEIDLICWRAEQDNRNKLYCIANAGLIDNKAARQCEKSLVRLSQSQKDIHLVVICCKEEGCHFVNFLDRNRVDVSAMVNTINETKKYVEGHMRIAKHKRPLPAANLDPERLCIRLVRSHRAGMGKSLKVNRLGHGLNDLNPDIQDNNLHVKIPLQRPHVDVNAFVEMFSKYASEPRKHVPRVFHIDIAHEVEEGVDYILFNLLVLGCLVNQDGVLWHRSNLDYYIIENIAILEMQGATNVDHYTARSLHRILDILPSLNCWSPTQSLSLLQGSNPDLRQRHTQHDQLMDDTIFRSPEWQRTYQYLKRFMLNDDISTVDPANPEDLTAEGIQILLRYCGINDPAWSELANFVQFFNHQMLTFENSYFCERCMEEVGDYITLPGFSKFVIKFMIQMSRDFSTRSLEIAEEDYERTRNEYDAEDENEVLAQYDMKRQWETSPHPYIFFNKDGMTMTFLGFTVTPQGDIVDPQTGGVLEAGAVSANLKKSLELNRVNLNENFDTLSREEQLAKLCCVMGITTEGQDWYNRLEANDTSFVLTADNVKKMLAIYMRFRCGIPVIIMGETGCGKTRLIKFMCDLQKPPGTNVNNMVLMKIHGGTTEAEIITKINKAEQLADNNFETHGIDTVLFFDETNTTEAIGLIKEVMCDHTVNGKPLKDTHSLRMVAACNPYKRHDPVIIERMENAGLGYHIKSNKTKDKLGRVPMRQLVYRVQRLPQSMRCLIWDFGQLNERVEQKYIEKMVERHIAQGRLPNMPNLAPVASNILTVSQEYMRNQREECHFVSLRDVERALTVMSFFHEHRESLYPLMDAVNSTEDDDPLLERDDVPDITRSLILALGVCYYSRLEQRHPYCEAILEHFQAPCSLTGTPETIEQQIVSCQTVFLDQVEDPGTNIAKNTALRENFFMMVVCIELRIPLFLVGKPGSSKSLAKTIVMDRAMQGSSSTSPLFRRFKSCQMISFQCSQVSSAEGIVATFRQCAQLQHKNDLRKMVAVVVLDEVGLAEDSDKMPLKTLHPLLEDGCQGDEQPAPHKKVGFIGISNWALDPAKMNRGIFLQRGIPTRQELKETASKICSEDHNVGNHIGTLFESAAECYEELCGKAIEEGKREFFGLRDYYSLMKALYAFAARSRAPPTWGEIQHAVKRNFGGLATVDPVQIFQKRMNSMIHPPHVNDPDNSPLGLVAASLSNDELNKGSRYLLILTENYAALDCVQRQLPSAITIYGSSFPKDQEYTQLCRNINTIKMCMETGRPVILLKLDDLYESLYDALNQYYILLFGKKFVYLGLGTQRMKVKVHDNFKLVLVAEKDAVLERFPIPLINRLEKQFLSMETLLSPQQLELAIQLQGWTELFATIIKDTISVRSQPKPGDVFVGFHEDTIYALLIQVCSKIPIGHHQDDHIWSREVLEQCKQRLMQCATPDAVLRLSQTALHETEPEINQYFFHELHIYSLSDLLGAQLILPQHENRFLQVTTHSRLMSNAEANHLMIEGLKDTQINMHYIHEFSTDQQFCRCFHEFFCDQSQVDRMLILQCGAGDRHSDLINCARYNILNKYADSYDVRQPHARRHVILIVQLPRVAGGCFVGFQGQWDCFHVDELIMPDRNFEDPLQLVRFNDISSIFRDAGGLRQGEELMETEDNLDRGVQPFMRVREVPACSILENIHHRSNDGIVKDKYHTGVGPMIRQGMNINVDADVVMRRCLLQALSRLHDAPQWSQRKAQRVALLFDLLSVPPVGPGLCFQRVLNDKIFELLQQKEETMSIRRSWQQIAVRFEAMNKSGTCRRALFEYVDSQVTPLLAGLLALLDTHCNLDLLQKHPSQSWQHQLWLAMATNPPFLQLNFSTIQPMIRGTEVMVYNTAQDETFQARLPFSWVIKEQLDTIIKAETSLNRLVAVDNEPHMVEKRILHQLPAMPLGGALEAGLQHGGSARGVTISYLEDFAHMIYKHRTSDSELEYQLVGDAIFKSARMLHTIAVDREETDGDFELSLPGVHLAYAAIQQRLLLLAQLFTLTPDLINNLATKEDQIIEEPSLTLDAEALYQCLSGSLSPTFPKVKEHSLRQQWVAAVDKLQPVIEQLLHCLDDVNLNHGLSQPAAIRLAQSRCLWTRILTVKLFIFHVCNERWKASMSVLRCMPLYDMLGKVDQVDFKKAQTLMKLEQFLKMINRSACKAFLGSESQCPVCKETMHDPIRLPTCQHIVCQTCVQDWVRNYGRNCPMCDAKYSAGHTLAVIEDKRHEAEQHQQFRRCCNSFFLDVVTRLCFGGSMPPAADTVDMLLGYVTRTSTVPSDTPRPPATHNLNVFDDSIDSTPIVRSLLLKLLLQTDVDQVDQHLNHYLNRMGDVLDDRSHLVELSTLVVYCLEDHYQTQMGEMSGPRHRAALCSRLLQQAANHLTTVHVDVHKLKAIAGTRCGLREVAQWIHTQFILNPQQQKRYHNRHSDEAVMLRISQELCEQHEELRMYLLRHLNARYGLECVQQLGSEDQLQWIIPPEDRNDRNTTAPDPFTMFGEDYKTVRGSITRHCIRANAEMVIQTVHEIDDDAWRLRYLLLALFREVTCRYAVEEVNRRPSQNVMETLQTALTEERLCDMALPTRLLTNTLGSNCTQLTLLPGMSAVNLQLVELVVHWLVTCATTQHALLQPLAVLIQQPVHMQNALLPTMPEDNLIEVREALLDGRRHRGGDDNPFIWQCPNGHPYVIGNCGRPTMTARCLECHAPIGGVGHRAEPGNIRAHDNKGNRKASYLLYVIRHDETRPGHILGPADQRPLAPERQLSPAATGILRALLHISLLGGADTNMQDIHALIEPRPADVSQFLWLHLTYDLVRLSNTFAKSMDDTILILHLIMKHITDTPTAAITRRGRPWETRQERARWETQFTQTFMTPVIQNLEPRMTEVHTCMVNDQDMASQLVQHLYATEWEEPWDDQRRLETDPAMWRPRTTLTVDWLTHELEQHVSDTAGVEDTLAIIRLFLQNRHLLEALVHLPSIVRLQRLLRQHVHHKLDRRQAEQLTVTSFVARLPQGQHSEYQDLVEHFKQAWDIVRNTQQQFTGFRFHVVEGRVLTDWLSVPAGLCDMPVTADTPITWLVPAQRGPGLCSLGLVHFLADVQNNFLNQYIRLRKCRLGQPMNVQEVTVAHLVTFDSDRDLLPVLLANCTYSLQAGQPTAQQFDFSGMQRQIEERFIRFRTEVDASSVQLISYSTDLGSAHMLAELRDKIRQEPLSDVLQNQLSCQHMNLLNLNDCLSAVDVAIPFLVASDGAPDQPLVEFVGETLQLQCASLRNRAAGCQLQHTRALWLTLAHQRAQLLHSHRQNPFDTIDEKYSEPVTPAQVEALREALRYMNAHVLLNQLYECLVLNITLFQDPDAEDYQDNQDFPLRDVLENYFFDKDFARFPDDILSKQVVCTWKEVIRLSRDADLD